MKKILDFPTLRQMDEYDCGASAMQSVLDYYGIDVGENNIIRLAKNKKSGTSTAGLKKLQSILV
jgi:ABC-type bacteriocin/lantibiotic exporter with double-glycine peptidase domain